MEISTLGDRATRANLAAGPVLQYAEMAPTAPGATTFKLVLYYDRVSR
jgi:hypothetical protein